MSRLLLLLAALPLTGLGAPTQEPKADLPRDLGRRPRCLRVRGLRVHRLDALNPGS